MKKTSLIITAVMLTLLVACQGAEGVMSETTPVGGAERMTTEVPTGEFSTTETTTEVPTTEAPTTTAHVHDYAEVVTTEATCTAEGVKTFTCECGDSYTGTIPATGHSHESVVTKEKTCEEDGMCTYTCACGDSFEIPIAAIGHSHEKIVTKEKTCEEDGMCTYTCICGDSYERPLAATGHSFGAYAYNNDATYLADGTETAKCSVCGAEDIRTAEGTRKDDGFTDTRRKMRTRVDTKFYESPSESANAMKSVSALTLVWAEGYSADRQWYRVELDGTIGYMKMDHLITRDYEETNADYNIFEGCQGISEEKLNGFTFTDMDEIWYTGGHTGFLDTPYMPEDVWSYKYQRIGTACIFVPIHITGKCNECNFYRAEVDGITVYIAGGSPGDLNPRFLTELPVATKGDPGLEPGTKEWHDYWDGTTMGEMMAITGFTPWVKIYMSDGVSYIYLSYYPHDYVIGSYAVIELKGCYGKGAY